MPLVLLPRVKLLETIVLCALFSAPVRCQDSGAEGTMLRGNRAELAITVRDSSGEPIAAPATVKLFHSGAPAAQQPTSHGRAFFILPTLGDYALTVEASGYQMVQREISASVAVRFEVDIYLKRNAEAKEETAVSDRPLLAPKAREAFEKALEALAENKFDEAEKKLHEAMKLAPGHPDVLYAQGVLELKRKNWTAAQNVLEKATQVDPNHARALAGLGMALANQGKYDAAIPPLEKSLQIDPGSWEARWTLGKAFYYDQRFDEALKEAKEALSGSNGKAPEIELLVAQSLTAVGRYDDSAQVLRDFIKNHHDRPEAATAKRWLDRLTADGKVSRN